MTERSPASRHRLAAAVVVVAGAFALSGCAGMVVGGAAATGVAVAQERSVGAAVDDTAIKVQVNERILRESEPLFVKVSTDVVEGRVLLTGVVQSEADRDRAGRLTWEIGGVREVLNELQVSPSGDVADYVKDASISTELRFKMYSDRDIYAINYAVTTVNGVVYLMGIARSEAELNKLVDHARNIRGVTRVVSHVLLKDDPRRKSRA